MTKKGIRNAPPIRVIIGAGAHSSVKAALSVLGFGTEEIEVVPVDEYGSINVEKLPILDSHTLLIIQAGNVSGGAYDPIDTLCEAARKADAWIHVDGAFGLWAAMASIIKRKKNYSVIYNYVDENGETRQKWETWPTHKEALKRKAEIENQINTGTFLPPSNQTVSEFMYDFVSLYGEKKWSASMYDSSCALIAIYITPIIGDVGIQTITPRVADQYVQTLQKTRLVVKRNRKPKSEYLSETNIEKIIKLLRCAFKQAVRWELIGKNSFDFVVLPKAKYQKRDIWDAETIRTALDQCTDSKLYVAMNLAFACSLRIGEILGLTWDNVHISDEDIAEDNAYVYIDKELTRASKRAIEAIGEKDIYYIFTPLMPNTSTRLILKKPKTDSSIRKIWLPKTVAYILLEWKKAQDELKSFLGDEYQEFNLVVALANGRPCENRILEKEFVALREKAGLPNVVFHSLRHYGECFKMVSDCQLS